MQKIYAQFLEFNKNQLALTVLAIISLVFSFLNLLTDFIAFGRISEILMLSLTILKVALYDSFNLAILMCRCVEDEKMKEKMKKEETGVESESDSEETFRPFSLRSSRIRECFVEIADDTFGALPAVLAVSMFNANRAGEPFFIKDEAVMTYLVLVACLMKFVRLIQEMFVIIHRHRYYRLHLSNVLINDVGIIATILSLCHLIVLELLLQNIQTPVDYICFLPVMHLPYLKKNEKARKSLVE